MQYWTIKTQKMNQSSDTLFPYEFRTTKRSQVLVSPFFLIDPFFHIFSFNYPLSQLILLPKALHGFLRNKQVSLTSLCKEDKTRMAHNYHPLILSLLISPYYTNSLWLYGDTSAVRYFYRIKPLAIAVTKRFLHMFP